MGECGTAALRFELYVTLAMITCSATCSILATRLTATGHDGVLGDTRARLASSLADARRHSSIHSGDVSSLQVRNSKHAWLCSCLVVYEYHSCLVV